MNATIVMAVLLMAATTERAGPLVAAPAPKRWSDADLVASYRELASGGGLEGAVRSPVLPKDTPQPGFLEALAWYAAGTPKQSGELTLLQLDEQITPNVGSYLRLLKSKVERGEDNDYARTRTWKLIQKFTLLRDEMSRPTRNGRYPYQAMTKAAGDPGADAWDREHTLRSSEEFVEKVCRGSYARPVIVKYGNTNCTQCMLFEIIGSVKTFAENPKHKGAFDVYKVWWGYAPDGGFAGRIRNPERLDALVKAEGVNSSPYFIVYRNGRRYPCGDAFPDDSGRDERLESCLRQEPGEAPMAGVCEPGESAAATAGKSR